MYHWYLCIAGRVCIVVLGVSVYSWFLNIICISVLLVSVNCGYLCIELVTVYFWYLCIVVICVLLVSVY